MNIQKSASKNSLFFKTLVQQMHSKVKLITGALPKKMSNTIDVFENNTKITSNTKKVLDTADFCIDTFKRIGESSAKKVCGHQG